METLRVSFLSGSVLELAATLGVALVAVTPGVRLVSGDLGLQAGLTVMVLAPELYLPFRRLGAEYHASADGLAVAERMFALLDAPAAVPGRRSRLAPSPARASVRFERVSFSTRRARARARRARARALAGRDGGAGRRKRRRQEHGGRPAARSARADRRPDHRRRRRPERLRRRLEAPDRLGAAASDAVPGHRRRQHPARRSGRLGPAVRDAAALAGADEFIRACRRATTRSSATADARCRRASAGGSGWRGRSSATRRS